MSNLRDVGIEILTKIHATQSTITNCALNQVISAHTGSLRDICGDTLCRDCCFYRGNTEAFKADGGTYVDE